MITGTVRRNQAEIHLYVLGSMIRRRLLSRSSICCGELRVCPQTGRCNDGNGAQLALRITQSCLPIEFRVPWCVSTLQAQVRQSRCPNFTSITHTILPQMVPRKFLRERGSGASTDRLRHSRANVAQVNKNRMANEGKLCQYEKHKAAKFGEGMNRSLFGVLREVRSARTPWCLETSANSDCQRNPPNLIIASHFRILGSRVPVDPCASSLQSDGRDEALTEYTSLMLSMIVYYVEQEICSFPDLE